MDYTEDTLLELIARNDEHEAFYRQKLRELRRDKRNKKQFLSTTCPYCGAGVGEVCKVTLAPEVGPLSIQWQHGSREALLA
jgi:hypothetical protein